MRYGVLADVHGNLDALRAVLRALERHGVDRYLVAGDLVGYGPYPNECVAALAELPATCVAGNHDLIALGSAVGSPLHRARATQPALDRAGARPRRTRLPRGAPADGHGPRRRGRGARLTRRPAGIHDDARAGARPARTARGLATAPRSSCSGTRTGLSRSGGAPDGWAREARARCRSTPPCCSIPARSGSRASFGPARASPCSISTRGRRGSSQSRSTSMRAGPPFAAWGCRRGPVTCRPRCRARQRGPCVAAGRWH